MHQIVIVIPTLNESAYIGTVLRDVMVRNSDIPVWVFDGGSSDHTRQIIKGYKRLFPLLELHDNPGKTQARAINCAAMLAQSRGIKTLVRLDAHARYSPNFVQIVTDRLEQSGADNVVVPLVAEGKTLWQTAAADLQRSWLGNGGAAHRNGQAGGWVDHGQHAAFRLDQFVNTGGYNAQFKACEDVEFDIRLLKRGGRIYLEREAPVVYSPRETPIGIWRQMLRNGRYRVKTASLHRRSMGLRQLLPLVATGTVTLSLVGGAILDPVLALLAVIYVFLVAFLSIIAGCIRSPLNSI